MARRASAPTAAPAAAPRRTQRERSQHAEEALLDAAATLFARRGVDQTSLADIGELAGYSRGLANHHFGSKATLIEQLAKRFQNQFVERFPLDRDAQDTIEVLTDLVESYFVAISRRSKTARAFFVMWGAAIASDAQLRPVFAADDAQFRAGVETLLRQGQDNGSVDPSVDPSAGALALVGMLRGVMAQYLIDPKTVDLSTTVQTCQQFVRQTFAAPRKTRRAKT
ncbi:hypothetical protein A5669_05050 [Mycolicibacterium fortuitum]|uniref:TetR/AcrR family transcriptional regulator n=1 Tax=Mycolicibacterium fortuitum TaxID=1766 RepID=UPI0007EBA90C|nr:TetR/AcrR family transcriptional regulator [Mycolicibacterium fortuitum]OBG47686.1 hypothetical protein A5669_05050 [Mycolicibacterium fortuitum]